MAELVVQLIGESRLLEHSLSFSKARVHVSNIFEDVLSHQLVSAGSLLYFSLQQVPSFRAFQLLSLFVEGWWCFQSCNDKNKKTKIKKQL